VDRVNGAWTRQHGSGPRWTEAARTIGHSGVLLACGGRALGLVGACRRRWRRMSRMRQCRRGAHCSTRGSGEVTRQRQRMAAA
jgi:hypothetical protein